MKSMTICISQLEKRFSTKKSASKTAEVVTAVHKEATVEYGYSLIGGHHIETEKVSAGEVGYWVKGSSSSQKSY